MSHPSPPPPQPPLPQPPRPSRTAPLLAGAVLGGVDVVVTTVLGLSFGGIGTGFGAGWLPPAVGLLVPVGLLFSPSTRWWGVGLLIGYFLTLIVLGGACVALLAGLSSGG